MGLWLIWRKSGREEEWEKYVPGDGGRWDGIGGETCCHTTLGVGNTDDFLPPSGEEGRAMMGGGHGLGVLPEWSLLRDDLFSLSSLGKFWSLLVVHVCLSVSSGLGAFHGNEPEVLCHLFFFILLGGCLRSSLGLEDLAVLCFMYFQVCSLFFLWSRQHGWPGPAICAP